MTEPNSDPSQGDTRERIRQRKQDDTWREMWRSVNGPLSELNGPLIRFAALVQSAAEARADAAEQAAERFAFEAGEATLKFNSHTAHVEAFLTDLYAIMVDPLAEGDFTVAETCQAIREAALRDRASLHARAALEQEKGWQPIATAPKDGTEILVSHGGFASVVWWDETGEGWIVAALADNSIYAQDPTHWMKLPSPPALEQENRELKKECLRDGTDTANATDTATASTNDKD